MLPDYAALLQGADRQQFVEEYKAWKAAKQPQLKDEKKCHLPDRHLTDEDRRSLAKMVEDSEKDKDIDTTFGDKVYFTFERLAQDFPKMAAEFIAIGEELLEWINQRLPENNKML